MKENQTGSLADGRVAISYMLPSIRHESCFTVTNEQAANGLGQKRVTQVTSMSPASTEQTRVVEENPLGWCRVAGILEFGDEKAVMLE